MKSVYFKELHNEQEYYCPTIYRARAAVVSTITSYINTNEIPGELSRESTKTPMKTPMKYQVSFRAKTWYLHMWKYHRCYGYIIDRAFHTKKLFKWSGLVVHWCLYNNRTLHGHLEIQNFSFRVSFRIFQHSKRYFVSRLRAAMQYPLSGAPASIYDSDPFVEP